MSEGIILELIYVKYFSSNLDIHEDRPRQGVSSCLFCQEYLQGRYESDMNLTELLNTLLPVRVTIQHHGQGQDKVQTSKRNGISVKI